MKVLRAAAKVIILHRLFSRVRASLSPHLREASMTHSRLFTAAMLLGLAVGATQTLRAQTSAPPATPAGDGFTWGPAPAVFPPGAQMAVLQGNPAAAGQVFTVRLRMPDGYTIAPHWHPTDEMVTVIDGTFLVGVGDRLDESKFLPPLAAGGFITAAAHMNHYARARGATVVQVTAVGPFAITYVNPADMPH
jgi:quercetin dioxygenase-like cupin family protein